jgi:hypothetical protein
VGATFASSAQAAGYAGLSKIGVSSGESSTTACDRDELDERRVPGPIKRQNRFIEPTVRHSDLPIETEDLAIPWPFE